MTSWSVSFNQFYERQHGWFSRRRSTTFKTRYTGFRFGSEFRLNFVYSFSAACVAKLLYISRRCSLSLFSSSDALRSHCSAARGDLIIPRTFTKTFGPRGFAVSGLTAWNSLPACLKDKDLSPAIFRSKLKTHFLVPKSLMCFQHWFADSPIYVSACYIVLAIYAALSQWLLICKGALTNDFSYRFSS